MHEQLRHLIVGKSDRVQHDQPVNSVRRDKNVFADNLQCRPAVTELLRLIFIFVDLRIVTGEADVVR